jgi:hypothetical protein
MAGMIISVGLDDAGPEKPNNKYRMVPAEYLIINTVSVSTGTGTYCDCFNLSVPVPNTFYFQLQYYLGSYQEPDP